MAQVPGRATLPQFFGSKSQHIQGTVANHNLLLRVPGALQAKLTAGAPDDRYEHEADRVAEAVMRIPEPAVQRQEEEGTEQEEEEEKPDAVQTRPVAEQITPLVQRQAEEEIPGEEEEEPIQTKSMPGERPHITPEVSAQIESLQGRGQPLPQSVRTFFEPRFGYDFDQVRVHTDTQASETAQVLKARAYTIGQDIVFGSGQYMPETRSVSLLLAHELAHVVQQNATSGRKQGSRPERQITCTHGQPHPSLTGFPGGWKFSETERETVNGLDWQGAASIRNLTQSSSIKADQTIARRYPEESVPVRSLRNPRSAETDATLVADTPEGVKLWEERAKSDREEGFTVRIADDPASPLHKLVPGSHIGVGTTVLCRVVGMVYYKHGNVIRRMTPSEFLRWVSVGVSAEQGTKYIAPHVRKFEYLGLFAMVAIRPYMALEVIECWEQGIDPVSTTAGKKYVAAAIMGKIFEPLGKLVKKIPREALRRFMDYCCTAVSEAGKSAIRQILANQDVRAGKVGESMIKGLVAKYVSEKIIALSPAMVREILTDVPELAKPFGKAHQAFTKVAQFLRYEEELIRKKLDKMATQLIDKTLKASYERVKSSLAIGAPGK